MRRAARLVLLSLALAGCRRHPEPVGPDPAQQAALSVDAALQGTWRLASYMPTQPLTGALLAGIQKDRVLARFESNHLRSASPDFTFDRRYRLGPVIGDTFQLFITDEHGVEYRADCRFDGPNRLLFDARTEPWRGSGAVDRVAP